MSGLSFSRRTLAIIILIILAITIPLTLYVVSQQQDVRQKAAEGDPSILATIDGQPVSEQDVKTFASEDYKTTPDDPTILQTALDRLIELRILEKVMAEQNIQITDQDITTQLAYEELSGFVDNSSIRQAARISVMRRKVETLFTKTRQVFNVGFWIPPENYGVQLTPEQQTLVATQRTQGRLALPEIEQAMRAGDEPLAIARAMVAKYPSLQTIMAVNGYILDKNKNELLFTTPVVYSFQKGRENITFFKVLFSLNAGQVGVVEDPRTSAGGVVIRVVGVTDGQFDNYSQWFADQKAKRVVVQ